MRTFGRVLAFILGVGTIIAGTYCLFTPETTTLALAYVIGVVMIVDAIIKFISWFSLKEEFGGDAILLFSAVISLILGVLLVVDGFAQWMLDMIIVYATGAWVIVSGILRIVRSFKVKELKGGKAVKAMAKNWWVMLVFGITLVALGIFMLLNPITVMVAVGILVALAIIFVGANLLTFALV
ncbi:DUF308 domain-containing protein [Candidatus Saccharibacteria bacterium]|nr:DUF308 domain-containing protein [Candidatus Saccharibacteria bacterium]